jgi:hypothetical protein
MIFLFNMIGRKGSGSEYASAVVRNPRAISAFFGNDDGVGGRCPKGRKRGGGFVRAKLPEQVQRGVGAIEGKTLSKNDK